MARYIGDSNRKPTCFPNKPSRVLIPSTGNSDYPFGENRANGTWVALAAASDRSRLFSPFPVQSRGCHLSRECPLLVGAAVHEESVRLKLKAHPRIVSGERNSTCFCPVCSRSGFANPRSSRLAAFSRHPSEC